MTWSVSNESAPVRRAPAKRARACPTESQEQKSLFKWWRVYSRHAPHLVMYHIPNGGRRDAITGARLKAEGVVAGVPDIFLAVPRQGFHGLYVELKRQKGGSLESSQEDIIARLRVPRRGLHGLVGGAGSHRKLSDRGNPQRSVQACRASSKPAVPRGSSRLLCRSGKMKAL